MTQSEPTIASCPFCGGNAYSCEGAGEECFVECNRCGCSTLMKETKAEAIAAWNTRANDARIEAQERTIAELRAERDALLQRPIDLAKMDSIDEDATDRMIAYYWYEQAQEARKALGGTDEDRA